MRPIRTVEFAAFLALVTGWLAAPGCSGPGGGSSASDTRVGDAVDAPTDGRDTRPASDPSVGRPDTGTAPPPDGRSTGPSCEQLCDRVHDECGLFLQYYDAEKVPKSGCVDACRWGYFIDERECIMQKTCSKESLNACITLDPASPELASLDPESRWPKSWKKYDRQVFALVNLHRRRGVTCGDRTYEPTEPLTWNDEIAEAARAHSLDMAKNDFYGHDGSDGSLPGSRIARTDYGSPRASGEAINRTFSNPFAAVKSWLESPSHCRRMVSPTHPYRHVGSGYVYAPNHEHTHLWTLDYAAR